MAAEPLFKGLISDEFDHPVDTAIVGSEPCYVIDDAGFKRHVPSRPIDLEILRSLFKQVEGNEDIIAAQAAKMTGQDDIFSHAILEASLKNIDKQYEFLLDHGIPEETRAYLGLMGFRVVLDIRGNILKLEYPSAPSSE
ncbi:MAG TPA: hypothetical protein PKK09_00510 [Anaerolineaceae bacterium]|nr:hypothetical protein [Chloroflexota bacterium]HNS06421.1 hypothetical protein [Anaerolineaceae bacterium]HNW14266.1 hypothetical protein [Anaerolineaceae bacterium]HOE02777.1 hypothetical protein [Anaerolineaceae bacterium]HOQ69449.1 hypothetical protein [Anaerolineaceae bacterium]